MTHKIAEGGGRKKYSLNETFFAAFLLGFSKKSREFECISL